MDAVGEDVDTHVHVDASALVVSKAELPLQLLLLLAQHMQAEPDYKVRASDVGAQGTPALMLLVRTPCSERVGLQIWSFFLVNS